MGQDVKSVGAVFTERVVALINVLAPEPKHAELDGAYRAVKAVLDRVLGTPDRDLASFTEDGDRMVIPAQPPVHDFTEEWDESQPEPVPALVLAKAREKGNKGGRGRASQKSGATSSDGDSGASSGKADPKEQGSAPADTPTTT